MRLPVIILVSLLAPLILGQQITRIATLDYAKILVYFEQDSLTVQNYQQEKDTVQQRIQQLNREIKALQSSRDEAEKNGKSSLANVYQRRIDSKKSYLDSYLRNQVKRLAYLQQRILSQNKLAFELQKAVDLTARERGISLVLNKDTPSILWSSADIDLTAPVLQRLKMQLKVEEPELETLPLLDEVEEPPTEPSPPPQKLLPAEPSETGGP